MTPKEVIRELWNRDWSINALVLCLLAFLGMYAPIVLHLKTEWYFRECGMIFGVLVPSCLDSIGFFLTQDNDAPVSVNRGRYRVIQFIPQWFLIYPMLFRECGGFAMLGCMLAWWFATNDRLFYVLRKSSDYNAEYTWLGSSFFALVLRMKVFQKQFNIQASIGLVLAIILALL